MQRIILAMSIIILAILALQVYSNPSLITEEAEEDPTSIIDSQPSQQNSTQLDENSSNPSLLWASDQVKYWVFDQAVINPQKWDKEWAIQFNEIRHFTGFNQSFQLELFAYPSVEQKALRTKNMKEAHTDQGAVHLVSNQHFKGENWGEQYRPLIHAALGTPKHINLEIGLAMQWCGTIKGEKVSHWANLLAQSKSLPKLTSLYEENTLESESPLASKIAAASWVNYCIERWGKMWFLEHYKATAPTLATLEQWNDEWQHWILEKAPLNIVTINTPTNQQLNGFTFAHEGYRIYNGYGSELARQSLVHLETLGTNAVAIVPYSYMRSAHKPDPIPIVQGVGTENDEAVLFSHFTAQSLDQFTLLKPHIWITGSWPGDIDFETDQQWQEFLQHYRKWIMHFALLAEMNHFDAFCIGTELRHVTLKHPDYWRVLIKDIRKIYHGSITYAANWGEECEKMTFWDELDFIGINCYYPLHKKDTATREDLTKGVARNLAKIKSIHQEFQRPVWLTEVGFRSATAPWKSPHEEAGVRLIDDEAQALCYDVLLTELGKNDCVKGMFWWKWPCHLGHNESHGRGYMPYGKETEAVVKRFFSN